MPHDVFTVFLSTFHSQTTVPWGQARPKGLHIEKRIALCKEVLLLPKTASLKNMQCISTPAKRKHSGAEDTLAAVKAHCLSSLDLWAIGMELLQVLPKHLLSLHPSSAPPGQPSHTTASPQAAANNKIETPREINGSAYGNCKRGAGKGGT